MFRPKPDIRTLTSLLLSGCLLWPFAMVQAQSEGDAEPVEVLAGDSIEVSEQGDAVKVRGNVEIRRGQTVFGADAVDVRRSAQTLRAEGSVFLRDPRYRLTASRLEMNLIDETATILDGDVFIEEGHISFSGSRLQKFPGQVYEVQDGLFTTCLCDTGTPPWRIGARELRLRREGEVVADDATFYVYDVPVLYLPYVYFPPLSQRTTGLLFPSFGWSDENGMLYRQPFFWALDKSNDATLNFAVESKTRLGVAGQYRTVPSRAAHGRLDVAYFSERMRDTRVAADKHIADAEIPEDRWSALLTHRHRGPWATFSDVALYSDSLVTRELLEFTDLGSDARRLARTSRYSASRLGFYRHESGMTLQGLLDYQQDLVQPQRHTLHRVPHLSFSGNRPLDDRLGFGWHVQLTNFVREKHADGLRVDIRPELTWPVNLGRHFRFATSVALRETLYRLDAVEGRFDEQGGFTGKFPRNSSRELFEVRGSLATSLSRVYEWNEGAWSRIRHVVEPAVEYLFIPHTDQSRLPIWDGIDRINRRNVLTVSLTNRLWGVSGGVAAGEPVTVRRLAVARVATSFDIDRSRGGRDDLSDVDVGVRLSPARNLDVDAGVGLDPGPWNLRQAVAGFSVSGDAPLETRVADRDFARPNRLSLRYRHIRKNPLAPLATNANLHPAAVDCPPGDSGCEQRNPLNGVQADALLRVSDQVLWLYDGNYDGEAGRMTRNRGSIKYLSECECWTFMVSVDRQTNPDRTLFSVKFNLLGLGS